MKRQRVLFDGELLDPVRERHEDIAPVPRLHGLEPGQHLTHPVLKAGHVPQAGRGPGLGRTGLRLAQQPPAGVPDFPVAVPPCRHVFEREGA